jgi:hypothetical protein
MRARCLNPQSARYADYGGRGITVCPTWDDFETFLRDMGPKPSPRHSIDRIDNDRGYSPENCKWSTTTEQNRNTRLNVWLTYNGQTMLLEDWGRLTGIPAGKLRWRQLKGWPPEDILSSKSWARCSKH